MAAERQEKAFQDWLARLTQIALPKNKLARVRTLAKELAEGAAEGFWNTQFSFIAEAIPGKDEASGMDNTRYRTIPQNALMRRYFDERWHNPDFNDFPEYGITITRGFLRFTKDVYDRVNGVELLDPAFALLDELEPSNVFISYKRTESSALALLVLARLKAIGLNPFVDMSIDPGANWKDFLREKIEASDYVVLLLGPKTLESTMTQQEIIWAKQLRKVVIPIWHGGFQYRSGEWRVLPEIDEALTDTHTIIVQNESAGGYNAALTELINRFGFTP
ncbi:MAG: toll/interleukin-1 receptor domain-containing protein [bacterium]|nr:toll/interleukin-1 receptor domain-containing protein [bacterium]